MPGWRGVLHRRSSRMASRRWPMKPSSMHESLSSDSHLRTIRLHATRLYVIRLCAIRFAWLQKTCERLTSRVHSADTHIQTRYPGDQRCLSLVLVACESSCDGARLYSPLGRQPSTYLRVKPTTLRSTTYTPPDITYHTLPPYLQLLAGPNASWPDRLASPHVHPKIGWTNALGESCLFVLPATCCFLERGAKALRHGAIQLCPNIGALSRPSFDNQSAEVHCTTATDALRLRASD